MFSAVTDQKMAQSGFQIMRSGEIFYINWPPGQTNIFFFSKKLNIEEKPEKWVKLPVIPDIGPWGTLGGDDEASPKRTYQTWLKPKICQIWVLISLLYIPNEFILTKESAYLMGLLSNMVFESNTYLLFQLNSYKVYSIFGIESVN